MLACSIDVSVWHQVSMQPVWVQKPTHPNSVTRLQKSAQGIVIKVKQVIYFAVQSLQGL